MTPGQTREGVVLTLGRGVHVTGRIFDGNRRPLAGVRVELSDGSEVLTDAYGVFDAGYRGGRERLVLRGVGLIPEVVELDLRREDVAIERLMQPAEGELTGRVRGGNDRPIAGVRVTWTPTDGLTATQVGWTDERRLFEFSQLAPGTGLIELDHPDYAPGQRSLKVAAGARGGAGGAVAGGGQAARSAPCSRSSSRRRCATPAARVAYNLACIFGASLAPYAAQWLAARYGLRAVGYYLAAAALVSLGGLAAIRQTRDTAL